MVHELRALHRLAADRNEKPSAVIIDSRTLQSTPESGAKRKTGSKIHIAVDTLGHLLALHATPADKQDRTQIKNTAKAVQKATGKKIEIAYVIKATPGSRRRTTRTAKASTCMSSSFPRRNGISCCFLVAGWWSGASRGWRGSGGSRRMTNGYQECSNGFIWPSLFASC
jgi:hypothetical protein